MFNRSNILIVLIALAGAGLGLLLGSRFNRPAERIPAGMTVLRAGDIRADLRLPAADGRQRALSEWDGKLLLINFWATWCGPCREEMPLLDALNAGAGAQRVAVLGIAIDDADAVKQYLRDYPVRYPILIGGDDNDNPSVRFGDTRGVLPYSVLIGADGTILAQRAGSFSGDSLADWLKPYL